MTFCVTCVVDKIVVTHFRKPVDGVASGTVDEICAIGNCDSSIIVNVCADSNQNKQVTYQTR